MSISREEIERGVLPSSKSAEAMMMEKIRQDYRDAVAARLARRRSQPPYQLEMKGQGLDPTLMSLRGKEPLTDLEAIAQGLLVGSYPSRPLSAAPRQLNIFDAPSGAPDPIAGALARYLAEAQNYPQGAGGGLVHTPAPPNPRRVGATRMAGSIPVGPLLAALLAPAAGAVIQQSGD
tara:strand:- start:270 stop:800 length:531 start_codon:yes stop_codon:yes gene_type:complete